MAAQFLSPQLTDARVRVVDYRPNQVVDLETAPGYQLAVAFSPDEQIQTVALGDSGAWQVTASKAGDQLFVKATSSGNTTNMTVVTTTRQYTFELHALSAPSPTMAYSVAFRYPTPASATAEPQRIVGRYKVTGARALQPFKISDDGVRTFIEWPRNADLPATYAVDRRGRERLVNGMFRGDRLVIDAVVPRLVFRLDQQIARAKRSPVGASR